jgi:hypothetical protein
MEKHNLETLRGTVWRSRAFGYLVLVASAGARSVSAVYAYVDENGTIQRESTPSVIDYTLDELKSGFECIYTPD